MKTSAESQGLKGVFGVKQKIQYFYIQPNGPRPDYRLVKAFLWHDAQNVDSDGDADNPASREWTYLFLSNRDNKAEHVMISPTIRQEHPEGSPVLEVKSRFDYLAARCAFFLAVSTQSNVSEEENKTAFSPTVLVERMGTGFDIKAVLRRVENSPFSRSTFEDPYLNLSSPIL